MTENPGRYESGFKNGARQFIILVADDDPNTRQFLIIALKSHNFRVYTVENGQQAIEFLQCHHPDLIILDLMMPEMNGAQVCNWIRQRNMVVPILVLTSYNDLALRRSVLASGADDYMAKPFVIQVLLVRIQSLLIRSMTRALVTAKQDTPGEPVEQNPNLAR